MSRSNGRHLTHKEAKMKYFKVKAGEDKKYNYIPIISKLLTKHGWIRVPWFVSWKEKENAQKL